MKSYSKFQNYLSLLMFITINILFYFKYLSKISIACGAITSVLYILFIIFLFKYKPTFGRKLVNVGIITFIIATSSLLFFIPKEIFTADQMDYYRSFLGLRFKRSVPLCRKNFYRQLSGGNAVLFSSLLSILLYTRNRIHNRYFHCFAGIPFQT